MKILSIDTCFSACLVAVLDTETGQSASVILETERGQAEKLVPLIGQAMDRAGLRYADLDLIAVNKGPGSFTGIRIGIATARGLGLALSRPVQGVCALDALYATARGQNPSLAAGEIRVAIDTGRMDYFCAVYTGQADIPVPLSKIVVQKTPSKLHTIVIGTVPESPLKWPDPVVLAVLANDLYQSGPVSDRGRAEPVYIREAEVSVSKKTGRVLMDPSVVNT